MDLWTDTFKAKEVDGWAIMARRFNNEDIYEVHVDRGLAEQRLEQIGRDGRKSGGSYRLKGVKVYIQKLDSPGTD